MKPCKKCGEVKPLTEFHRARDNRDGHRNECKSCWRSLQKQWYQRNREYAIARTQRWRDANQDKYAEWKRRNREENKPCRRAQERRGHLRRKYGLTPEEYDFLRVAQSDECAICGTPDEAGLHIDHHHETGLIRGLLCGKCNKAIGLLKEDPVLFDAASSYLQRTQLPLGCGDKNRPPTRVRRRTERPPVPEDQ